jgi:hypothetical protein
MKSHVTGNSQVAASAPTLHLGTYRRAIMAVLSADVFTPAERLRANDSVYQTEDNAKLTLWLKNVRRVFTEREAMLEQADLSEVEALPVAYATAAQTSEIHSLALHRFITKGERTKAMLALPTLDTVQATLLIGDLWAKVLHRTQLQITNKTPIPLPRYSQETARNRQQAYLLELRATLPSAIAAYDRAVASRAVLAQGAPTYYLEHVAEGWDLDEQGSRLNTAVLLLGFADLAEARQQLPLVAVALPALGAPAKVSYSQAC